MDETRPRARRLDGLNLALKAAEGRLYELAPGVSGRVALAHDLFLVWKKIDCEWRLGIAVGGAPPKRLLECLVEHRLQAALMLDELLVDITESLDEESQQIDAATLAADAFLAGQQEGLEGS